MYLACFVSFLIGICFALLISYLLHLKKTMSLKEELAIFKSKAFVQKDLQTMISQSFVKIASETIKNEQEDLRRQNKEALEEKLLPISKELKEFKDKVENFNLKGVENTTKIVEQISLLEKNNSIITQETHNLVEALTKNQNIKGSYGENLLDVVLQHSGMVEGVHYTKQFRTSAENLKDNDMHNIRPDVVINLPENRHLIIDSKVTLTSYLEYVKDNSKLNFFKSEVKKRISDLANKNYQNAENIYQPDFILMYMPIESSVNLIYEDLDIIKDAYKSNIIIVGTASLLTTIRLVNQLFAQKLQAESVNKIVDAGTNLYETFSVFCAELIEVQKESEGLTNKLNTLINRFKRNNKTNPSLFSQVERLKELGINTTKEIPSNLLENIEV